MYGARTGSFKRLFDGGVNLGYLKMRCATSDSRFQ